MHVLCKLIFRDKSPEQSRNRMTLKSRFIVLVAYHENNCKISILLIDMVSGWKCTEMCLYWQQLPQEKERHHQLLALMCYFLQSAGQRPSWFPSEDWKPQLRSEASVMTRRVIGGSVQSLASARCCWQSHGCSRDLRVDLKGRDVVIFWHRGQTLSCSPTVGDGARAAWMVPPQPHTWESPWDSPTGGGRVLAMNSLHWRHFLLSRDSCRDDFGWLAKNSIASVVQMLWW